MSDPTYDLEKQVPAPRDYPRTWRRSTRGSRRAATRSGTASAGLGEADLRGSDAYRRDAHLCRGSHVMFEAKFLSDISASTTYAPERDQIARNLDAGLAAVDFDLSASGTCSSARVASRRDRRGASTATSCPSIWIRWRPGGAGPRPAASGEAGWTSLSSLGTSAGSPGRRSALCLRPPRVLL